MADYSSSTQRKITQQIDIEFRLDVQEAKKLAIEGRKSSKASQEGIKAIEASIAKVNRALEKAQRSTGKRNKTEKEQLAFEKQKQQNIDKLKAKYKSLTAELNKLYGVEVKREVTSRKQAALDAQRAKNSTFAGGFARGVKGGTNSVIGGIGTSLGTLTRYLAGGAIIGGIAAIGNAFRTATKLGLDFETQVADLAAITGIATKEAKELATAAFDLAGKTKFSVEQIVALQKSLARLGFSKGDIIDLQEGVAGLAAATGEDLGKAAELTGKLIRAYNIATTDSVRVTNALVGTINNSAATLETLATALQYVSPIANQFGLTLEETNAAVGVLLNQGFTASRAGTGLRQILLETAKAGETLYDTLERISKEGLTATEAVELVGKRGAPALLALVNNTDRLAELTKEVANNFSTITAEAKTLTTTNAAFQNLGVAIKSAVTEAGLLGNFFRAIGVGLLSYVDKASAGKVASSKVTAALTSGDQKFIAAQGSGTVAEINIRKKLQEVLDSLRVRNGGDENAGGFVSAEEANIAEQYLDTLAKSLAKENALRKAREDGTKAANDYIKSQEGLGDVQGFEDRLFVQGKALTDSEINRAIDIITGDNGKINNLQSQLDLLDRGDYAGRARIETQIKALQGYVTQLLSINSTYVKEAQGLDTPSLREQYGLTKEEVSFLEKQVNKAGNSVEQLIEYQEQLDEAREKLAGFGKVLQSRGEELPSDSNTEEQLKTFEQIAKIEDSLREQVQLALDGKQIDVRASKQLQEEYENEIEALGDLDDEYRTYYEQRLKERAEAKRAKVADNPITGFSPINDSSRNIRSANISGSITKRSGLSDIRQALEDQRAILAEIGDPLIFDKVQNRITKLEEKEQDLINKRNGLLLDIGGEAVGLVTDQIQSRLDAEKKAIDARFDYEQDRLRSSLDSGIISQEQYEAQRLQLEKKRIAETNRIEKKEFNVNKVNSLAEIAISTAKAVMDNPALAPFIIGLGAAQAARVAMQKFVPVQYEDGGWINGPSHAAGGVPFTVNGVGGFEAEGGEYIINKRAMANPQVAAAAQALNSMGKRSVVTGNQIFEDGGGVTATSGMGSGVMEAILAELRKPSRSFVSEKELMERSNTQVRTDSRRRLQ